MAAWTAGARVGPYVLLAPISAGGRGEVWKARDTRLERMVAVKRLKERASTRFKEEARNRRAHHPHICQIHDIGPDYLALEYVEGSRGDFSTRLWMSSLISEVMISAVTE